MYATMNFEISALCKGLTAVVAAMRSFSCVSENMPLQFTGSDEALATPVTVIFKIVCVDSCDVFPHLRQLREPGRAERATVRPLSSMSFQVFGGVLVDLQMSGIVRHSAKRGTALVALSDLLTSVNASMNF